MVNQLNLQKHTILWAEDDKDDQQLFQYAFSTIKSHFNIHFVENGLEALAYLQNQNSQDLPALIVLDINMPLLDGKQTLLRIKQEESYCTIPTIVVSTSDLDEDIQFCKHQQTAFFTKPEDFNDVLDLVMNLLLYAGQMF